MLAQQSTSIEGSSDHTPSCLIPYTLALSSHHRCVESHTHSRSIQHATLHKYSYPQLDVCNYKILESNDDCAHADADDTATAAAATKGTTNALDADHDDPHVDGTYAHYHSLSITSTFLATAGDLVYQTNISTIHCSA